MDNNKKTTKNVKKQNGKNIEKKDNNKKINNNNKLKNVKNKNIKEKEKKLNNDKEIKKIVIKESEEIKEQKQEEKVKEIEENKNNIYKEEFDEPTNKKSLIILIAILLIVVAICIFYQIDDKNKEKSNQVSTEESNEIMDNFNKYFNNKKIKIIYYASSTCSYCELQTPIIEQIQKDYNIDYLYIDSSKLTKDDKEKILDELDIEHATPTTVIVKDGKVIDTQVGYADGGKMVEFFKENKVLKEDAVYTPEQYLTFINYEEYTKLLEKEGKQVITIGQTGCIHCTAVKPVLNTIAKEYNLTINYLNIKEMTQSESTSFQNSLIEIGYDEEEFLSNGNFGTPLTLIIENGKVISYIDGERPTTQFIRAFKKAGIISE